VAGRLRLELSQYRELEAFAQFGSDLDPDTQATLRRGERLVEALKQNERDPWPIENQVAAIFAGTSGALDRIKSERVGEFLDMAIQRLHSEIKDMMEQIGGGEWSDEIESQMRDAIFEAVDDFGPDFDEEGNPIEEGESDRVKDEEERKKGPKSEQNGDDEESSEEADEEKEEATA
jgi:F-type H+-transporting ATPase subunit alpha